jgi:hypothetical protein
VPGQGSLRTATIHQANKKADLSIRAEAGRPIKPIKLLKIITESYSIKRLYHNFKNKARGKK